MRGVGDGIKRDQEQKAEESVGEHDVEMQVGPEKEITEVGRNDDEQDHEAGRRKVRKLHDPKLPSVSTVAADRCPTRAGATIAGTWTTA